MHTDIPNVHTSTAHKNTYSGSGTGVSDHQHQQHTTPCSHALCTTSNDRREHESSTADSTSHSAKHRPSRSAQTDHQHANHRTAQSTHSTQHQPCTEHIDERATGERGEHSSTDGSTCHSAQHRASRRAQRNQRHAKHQTAQRTEDGGRCTMSVETTRPRRTTLTPHHTATPPLPTSTMNTSAYTRDVRVHHQHNRATTPPQRGHT
mmetsp:Transcript_19970/g.49799  ORF Transcript_19970/g.49799 Transcript_19970/m.49799 type:complete len:206 (+) Transcript_19970:711-1328(+)